MTGSHGVSDPGADIDPPPIDQQGRREYDAPGPPSADAASRERVLERFFTSYYRLHPVNATFTGVHDFDASLPDWSPEGLSAARREMSDLRRELATAGLGVLDDQALAARDWTAIDGALADAFLEVELMELDTAHYQRGNLSLAVGEAVFSIIALMTRSFAGIEQRAVAAASRLRAFPLFLVGVRRTLESTVIPEVWRERVLRECRGGQFVLDHVDAWLDAEGAPASARTDARIGLALARESLTWFASFVASLKPARPDRCAVGTTVLELLLRRCHWVDASPTRLRAEAHQAFDEELRRLDELIRHAGFNAWNEVQEELARHHPAPDGLVPALDSTWHSCRDIATAQQLLTWPDAPIRFTPIPRWTRAAAPYLYYLNYRSPAAFDDAPVADYTIPSVESLPDDSARESALRTWNTTAIKLNHVVHHAAVGHQVQNWHARRAASRIGQIAATDCACRIGMLCGGTMAEGWACYATDVMEDAGFFTPLEQVAQQHTRVRILARAVVDLELHTRRLSFDDAVALYVGIVGMSPDAARAETVKNSMFPGTAVMYWLGTHAIHQLRSARLQQLGDRFSLRAFHDELLSFGSIPVALAARIITLSS